MRIRMLVCQAGVDFVRNVGDEVEVGDAEAMRLIAAAYAEPVRRQVVERAVSPAKAEKAVK